MKKHKPKIPKQAKAASPEVFVLPPELLAKLGIKLVNLQPEVQPTTSQLTSSCVKNTEQSIDHRISNHIPEKEDASSIIETASLMKKSVFLSPTFFQTPPVVTPYEEEPIPNSDSRGSNISSEFTSVPNNEIISDVNMINQQSTSKLANNSNHISDCPLSEQFNVINNNKTVADIPLENCRSNLISTDKPQSVAGGIVPSDNSPPNVLVDDHADEAYLSDFSNSHSGCSPESISSERSKQKLQARTNKDMANVVNDMQRNNTEVQDMDIIDLPNDVVCQPVIIESKQMEKQDIVEITDRDRYKSTPKKRNKTNKSVIKNDSRESVITKIINSPSPVVARKVNKKVNDYIDKSELSEYSDHVDANNPCQPTTVTNAPVTLQEEVRLESKLSTSSDKFKPELVDSNKKSCVNINQTCNENKQISEIKNNSENKVKEIAAYLSQIVRERNVKIKRKSKYKGKEIEVDPTVSKLCIQGVEKPGGLEIQEILKVTQVTKTYMPKPLFRNRCHQVIAKPDPTTSDLFQLSNDDNTNLEKSAGVTEHQTKFCICFDFGNFAYYDSEVIYEHIHFLLHENIKCDSETLYSIYNEDFNVSIPNVDGVEHGLSNESDDFVATQNTLCWSVINALGDDIDIEVHATNDEKLTVTIETNTNQKRNHTVREKSSKLSKSAQETKKISNDLETKQLAEGRAEIRKRKSTNLQTEKIHKEIIVKPSKENITGTNSIITDTTIKLSDLAMNMSLKSQRNSTTSRRSSINMADDESPKKDNIVLAKNANKLLKKDRKISADNTTTETVYTTTSTNKNRNKFSKLRSNKIDVDMSSEDDIPLKKLRASKVKCETNMKSIQSAHDTNEESSDCSYPEDNETLTDPKSGKRPLKSKPAGPSAKKSNRTHSDKDHFVIGKCDSSNEKVYKKKDTNIQITAKLCKSESILCTSNIKMDDSIKDNSEELEVTDEEMVYEVSIISDNIMNETQNTESGESILPDSTIDTTFNDNTFGDTLPIEYSTPSAKVSNVSIKCGVCGTSVANQTDWNSHMWQEHNYLAWRVGDTPLDLNNDNKLRMHIQAISNKNGGLECSKCNLKRKHAKPFLRHIQMCTKEQTETNVQEMIEVEIFDDSNASVSRKPRCKKSLPNFTCDVCKEAVEQSDWIEHIRVRHKYLAWTTDEQPLNLYDDSEIKNHLNYISKSNGGLICSTCNSKWTYVKKYLTHSCNSQKEKVVKIPVEVKMDIPDVVTCGICNLDIQGRDWIKHIQVAHEYMAWIAGQSPLNEEDPEEVKAHLDMIIHDAGELVCTRCSERRTSTYAYLQHRAACVLTGFDLSLQTALPDPPVDKDTFVCGVCGVDGHIKRWKDHAMSKHYNIAWKVGEVPINLRNPYSVVKYLNEYKRKRGLICQQCNLSRTSSYGFYAHILTCGRSPEEIEDVMNVCEICHKKYLCIYRNQHMAAHRDSDMRREKREIMEQRAQEEALNPPPPPAPPLPMGKRRAAEKAKCVIRNYSMTVDGKPECACGDVFKNEEEFSAHNCSKRDENGNESDDSVKIESDSCVSEDENDDSFIDQILSDEEEGIPRKRKRSSRPESNKVQRLRYKIEHCSAYLSEAYTNFVRIHYTSENLFNIWRNSEYTIVPAEEREKYLPQLAESCKIMIGKQDNMWTYKRFDSRKTAYSLFTGGATQCISWVPPNPSNESLSLYLAVATHRGPDVPRHSANEVPVHPGSLQIWNFRRFEGRPQCALCLAHDYGIVWAMDWCPSGARDAPPPVVPQTIRVEVADPRLGLLAIACSNGSVYILAVPEPPPEQSKQEPPLYKLKPVAELRMTMTPERRLYQATSVKWSPQKGHSVIIVGYSDGSTALFDLNTESPFLVTSEEGVTIYYPFQDRLAESTSITSVGLLCTTDESCAVGGQFSSSMTGGTLCGRAARPAARTHLAVSAASHSPGWPAVTLAGDIPFMRAVSEMEWWGGGRRVGAARSWAACARCARVASAAQPAIRIHRQHPIYPEIKKMISAMLVMVPLQKKVKHKENDDLSMVVEPSSYNDAAAKYGLLLYNVAKTRSVQAKAQQICNKDDFQPERFPLSDIVAMAFCPSSKYHDWLACATHTGFVFIVNS